jgi:transcriptional regulator with XRE-family HTH domain
MLDQAIRRTITSHASVPGDRDTEERAQIGKEWALQIARFRRAHGLKQTAAAELLNVDQATISRWEKGRSLPDLKTQRRLRDIISQTTHEEALLKHWVSVAMGEVVLSTSERTILVSSQRYAAAHGLSQQEIIGRSSRPMYTEEGERYWQAVYATGFYRGEIASVTVVCRANALCGHDKYRCTKVVWAPVRLSHGQILLRGERASLTDEQFENARVQNGGPFRIVTMDELVS